METDKPITLKRDCDAVLIPRGDAVRLASGSKVWMTQSLGGSFTVMTDDGYMVRIAGEDADALGVESSAAAAGAVPEPMGPADAEKLVWDRLRECFDPEIPVNIVDLGLIYQCRVNPLGGGGNKAEVKFTLTAPGCGMGVILKEEIANKIRSVPGIKEVEVELVWDPPWNQSMMSEAAKLQLGMV